MKLIHQLEDEDERSDEYICPACGAENNNHGELNPQDRYCPECGQRLETA